MKAGKKEMADIKLKEGRITGLVTWCRNCLLKQGY
jgi:hypothetical protein